jgi:mannitol/fructose-specific phosphotransferase system IIA component (Ntr-type)
MAGSFDPNFPVVELPPSAASPEAAVNYLLGQLVQMGQLRPEDAAPLAAKILRREALSSSAIGRGVALPHAKSEAVNKVVGIIGRPAQPVAWPGASDDVPIHTVSLVIIPASPAGEWLRALEGVVRQLREGSAQGPSNPA